MTDRSRVILRDLVRARRDELARQRIKGRHVEFCSECGKARDLSGRRSASLCLACSQKTAKS